MNRFLAIFLISFCILFSGCKKEDTDASHLSVTGMLNVKSEIGVTTILNLKIEGNKSDTVFLSLKGIPEGINYSFSNPSGLPGFITTLTIFVTNQAPLGIFTPSLLITSANEKVQIPFSIQIDDELSLTVTVYDQTQYSAQYNTGKLSPNASVNLYLSDSDFNSGKIFSSISTDQYGNAYFYHLQAGIFLFTITNGDLSNISEKTLLNGFQQGFVTAGIFRNTSEILTSAQPTAKAGDLIYVDENGDGVINDLDRRKYDWLTVYKDTAYQKVIWIGL